MSKQRHNGGTRRRFLSCRSCIAMGQRLAEGDPIWITAPRARRKVVVGVNELGGKNEKENPKLVRKHPATAGPALLVRSQPHAELPGEPSPARTAAVREGHGQRRVSGTGQWRSSPPQQLRMGKRRTGAVAFVGDTRAILALLGRVLDTVPVYHPEPGSSRSLGASSLRRPPRSPRSPPPSRRRSSPPSLLRSPAGGRRGGGGSDW